MQEDLNQYKSAYDHSFKFYDENQWYLRKYADLMSARITERELSKVLSLGVGHRVVGNAILNLMQGGTVSEYHIIEGAKEIIDTFKSENKMDGVQIIHSYFEEFNPDTTYDAIEMGFILEHVNNPGAIIRKFKEFLRPDGVLFIAVPNARSLHRMIGHHAGMLPDVYRLSDHDLELGHKRYFDLPIILNLVEACGLRVTDNRGLMLKPITGAQMRTLNWGEDIISSLFIIGENYPEIANCIYLEAQQ